MKQTRIPINEITSYFKDYYKWKHTQKSYMKNMWK
jgi:hypothetical protein